MYDVAIIGAGPVGLATAIGLYERGVTNLVVLEQARELRAVGQQIALLPNGLWALHYLSPSALEAVRANRSSRAQRWLQKTPDGREFDSFSLRDEDWEAAYGIGRVPMRWYVLQQTLKDQLPQGTLCLDRRCVSVAEAPDSGYVRVNCCSRSE
ncbi:MAG: hypothetical protein BRC58_10110 [Cyanobacteria bacterium QS_8_64_29]|nr:MAG: hypothetical protein BRC58_10110 [Cyanobacteria bacterium QS_8_64_29]